MDVRDKRRLRVLYTSLGTTISFLVVIALWILLFENQARTVIYWLLDRPVSASLPEYMKTAAWKSEQQAYHTVDLALYGALINLQVTPSRIRDMNEPAMISGAKWTPIERRITVSGSYSLSECNLEISRAITRVGGTVSSAVERSRSRELQLDLAHNGKVTHRLYINRDLGLRKRTGRLAIVVTYLNEDSHDVVERLSEISRPVTFALLPWMPGVVDIANDLTKKNHEIAVLLPVQPPSFTRNILRRRSVLLAHTEGANLRITEDALATLPMARGILGYPGGLMANEVGILDLVIDELDKQDKYFLENPNTLYSANGQENGGARKGHIQAWGVLDSGYNPVVISMNLDRASLFALDNGQAIVIVDGRSHALQVLINQVSRLELRGIKFVRVSELLDN